MHAKPELEIYADDVKCSHGATTGQLDAEAMFYLRSRGLSERAARGMLLQAFARDVVESVRVDALREWLDARITERFTRSEERRVGKASRAQRAARQERAGEGAERSATVNGECSVIRSVW